MPEERKCCLPCCSKPTCKTFCLVILGLVLLAAAVFAGIQIGKKQVAPPELIPIDNDSVAIEVSPIPTIDPTANWGTYTNTEYGYSTRHPRNMKIADITSDSQWMGAQNCIRFELNRGICYEAMCNDLIFDIAIVPSKKTLKDYADENSQSSTEFPNWERKIFEEVRHGVLSGFKTVLEDAYRDINTYYFEFKKEQFLVIYYDYSYQEQERENDLRIIDLMLSTFKFLD